MLGLVSNAAKQVVHRDEQMADYPAAAAAMLNTGGEVGEAIEYGGRTDWRGFVVYAAAPTDSEVTAIKAALKAVFSTAEPATLSFLAGGDSIVFGTGGANNRTITAALHHRSAAGVLYRNIGIAGHRLELGYTGFDTASAAYLTPGVPNVYVSDYGHNDIKTNVTDAPSALTAVAAMKGQARHMAAKLRAYGFDMVIWQEAYADVTFTADQEAARDAWNAWLRSGPLAEDGLPCFDAVDTVASDAAFILSDAETDAGRGMAQGSNSSDGVHPNEVHAGTRADHLLAAYAAIPFALKYVPVAGQQGLPYTGYTPRVVKGTAPYAFTLAPGSAALPAGLALDAGTGVISGTPASAGTRSGIVLRAADSLGATAEAAFAISVAAAATITVECRRCDRHHGGHARGRQRRRRTGGDYDGRCGPCRHLGQFGRRGLDTAGPVRFELQRSHADGVHADSGRHGGRQGAERRPVRLAAGGDAGAARHRGDRGGGDGQLLAQRRHVRRSAGDHPKLDGRKPGHRRPRA